MEQYKTQVREFYENKKAEGKLPMSLIYPTPAKLRDECLRLFRDGCNEADIRILRTFLYYPQDKPLHERSIKRFDTDKFRPLCNYLKDKSVKSDDKNIDMLAWLIVFYPRPCGT